MRQLEYIEILYSSLPKNEPKTRARFLHVPCNSRNVEMTVLWFSLLARFRRAYREGRTAKRPIRDGR